MSESTEAPRPEPGDDTPDGWSPSPEQPWHPVGTTARLYDHGQRWCQDRDAHPQHQPSEYPAVTHLPNECQSYGAAFEAWAEDGTPGYLSAYLFRPFRFGQLRAGATDSPDRLAIEFTPWSGEDNPFRCFVPVVMIRDLAAHLTHTATVRDGWRPPRPIRRAGAE